MEKIRYEEMLPYEIISRRERFPVAFIGLGGLEWHGEHLAVGNDALKAEKFCELAATRSGGFAFPTLWYGEPRITGSVLLEADYDEKGDAKSKMGFQRRKFSKSYFGKTIKEQINFYQELLYHVLVQLNTLEMKAVCFLCGHYPIKDWALPVVEKFNKTFEDTQAFAGTEFDYCSSDPNVGGDHAALWETSYLWYLRPDCVDISIYSDRPDEEPLIGVYGIDPRKGVSIKHHVEGIDQKFEEDLWRHIDPRKGASIEIGRKACEIIVKGMIRKAKECIGKTR